MEVILASQSERRRQILGQMGVEFRVIPSNYQEEWDHAEDPETFASRTAIAKARDVSSYRRDDFVIGADTIVVLEDRIFGKPDHREEAFEMLKALSNRSHRVMTGFAIVRESDGTAITGVEITEVVFARISDTEIERYIATGEPMDKAGAYGIQGFGGSFVTSIKGCYFNVVGLPLRRVYEALTSLGVETMKC